MQDQQSEDVLQQVSRNLLKQQIQEAKRHLSELAAAPYQLIILGRLLLK